MLTNAQRPEPDSRVCPEIYRQRLIVEGLYRIPAIDEARVRDFFATLSRYMGMTPIAEPVIFSPDAVSRLHHGIGGFQPWAESGCALYTWREQRLFTLDVYSCKPFDNAALANFASAYLDGNQVGWRNA
jgi:S-adenosylmethionine decarboxylase